MFINHRSIVHDSGEVVLSMGSRSCFLVWGLRLFLSVCLFGFAPRCDAGNILVYPFDGSHWVNLKVQLEELHARGHKLTVIRSNSSWYINERSHLYSSITIPSQTNFEEHLGGILEKQLKAQLEGASPLTFSSNSFLSVMMKIHEIWLEDFIYILNNANIIKELRDAKYDLMLTDPDVAPGVILAKYLNLPLVLNVRWALIVDGQFLVAPSPLSYIPLPGSGFTEKMDYFQRVQNMFLYIMSSIHMYFIASRYKPICEKYIEGGCDIVSLLQDADIWLFRTDFVFDFPRPTMPNVIYIGGFQCKPAQPLPAELEDFVQSAGEHGVIVMTLGSVVNAMPLELTSEIASVFAKLPQKVIWKHTGSRPSTLGNNTLIVDWIPQKDLLGHPQTKVFVAHGGTNGVQEAIYHGVPMLGIPLFFDQFDNLLRVQARGAGKIITLSDLNGVSFEQGLREVLHQQHYRDNMQRLSRLHKDQPMTPMDRAVFWVEFVIRHKGAPHLRTQAYKMPWYSYYCVDVLLLLLTVVIGAVLGVVSVFRLLCCRSRTKMKQQ